MTRPASPRSLKKQKLLYKRMVADARVAMTQGVCLFITLVGERRVQG